MQVMFFVVRLCTALYLGVLIAVIFMAYIQLIRHNTRQNFNSQCSSMVMNYLRRPNPQINCHF